MSEVKVNKISPRSGTDVTLGDSGDTITIPAGATFDSSAATNTLPSTVVTTTGTQTLTNKTIDGSQLTDETVTTAKLAYNPNAFRNIIINGDMSIAQRGTSFAGFGNGDNGYHICDRWFSAEVGTPTCEFTLSQSTDVPTGQGFATSFKWDCTTAEDPISASTLIYMSQAIEGQNLQYLKKGTASAVSTTLSFWVKSVKTGTYTLSLYDQDNNRNISKAYTIDDASTWEKKTITFEGDTTGALDNDNAASLYFQFNLAAGTDYTSGTLATSWESYTAANAAVGQVNLSDSTSNEWYVTGVQLEAGTTASDFEFLPYDVNLTRCQRYYNKYVAPGGSSIGASYNGSSGFFFVYFPTTMRATPTKSSTSGTAFYRFYRLNSNDSITSLTDNGGGKEYMSFSFATTSAAGTSGELSVRPGGILEADAEL